MKLVSCILPTRGRRAWAAQAVECFKAQTYTHKQLTILDDSMDLSFDGAAFDLDPQINWFESTERTIARKRNLLCERTNGEIIIHLDSDDWSSPDRIADQVKRLEESGKAVTGYKTMLFYDLTDDHKVYEYRPHLPFEFAIGSSLCYLKSWWRDHPFSETEQFGTPPNVITKPRRIGEDNHFSDAARKANQLISVDAGSMMVARYHADSTSPKGFDRRINYQQRTIDDLPLGFPR